MPIILSIFVYLCFVVFVGIIIYCIVDFQINDNKIKKYYNSLNIGDIIECEIVDISDNPYTKQNYEFKVKILDKKDLYVKYEFGDGSTSTDNIYEFIKWVKK